MSSKSHIRLPGFFRRLRERRHLTQGEVAQRCGVTRTYVCSIEHGRVLGPSTELIAKLIAAMDLTQRESHALTRLAAQDRAMRAVSTDLPDRAQRFVSACLEADRLLPDGDVDAWIARLEMAVQNRTDFIVHIQCDGESAMT